VLIKTLLRHYDNTYRDFTDNVNQNLNLILIWHYDKTYIFSVTLKINSPLSFKCLVTSTKNTGTPIDYFQVEGKIFRTEESLKCNKKVY